MPLEIELPIDVICDVLEPDTIATGMTVMAPGGAILTIHPGDVQTRSLPPTAAYDSALIFTVLLEFATGPGKDIAIGLFANWLYDKMKSTKRGPHRRVRINRQSIEVSKDGLVKAITESIESEEE